MSAWNDILKAKLETLLGERGTGKDAAVRRGEVDAILTKAANLAASKAENAAKAQASEALTVARRAEAAVQSMVASVAETTVQTASDDTAQNERLFQAMSDLFQWNGGSYSLRVPAAGVIGRVGEDQIAYAAIKSAHIGDAEIKSANIAELTVDTLHIADNAVTTGVNAAKTEGYVASGTTSSRNVTMSATAGSRVTLFVKASCTGTITGGTTYLRVLWNGTVIFSQTATWSSGGGSSTLNIDEMITLTAIGGTNTLRFECETLAGVNRVFGPALLMEFKK